LEDLQTSKERLNLVGHVEIRILFFFFKLGLLGD
jgi:hypothetical protein